MKDIFQRLMFLFHWVGFICLALLILVGLPNWWNQVILGDGHMFVGNLERKCFWLAVLHYPIKWILTGNKSFFPWKS